MISQLQNDENNTEKKRLTNNKFCEEFSEEKSSLLSQRKENEILFEPFRKAMENAKNEVERGNEKYQLQQVIDPIKKLLAHPNYVASVSSSSSPSSSSSSSSSPSSPACSDIGDVESSIQSFVQSELFELAKWCLKHKCESSFVELLHLMPSNIKNSLTKSFEANHILLATPADGPDQDASCAICLEELGTDAQSSVCTYPCSHRFHAKCVKAMRSYSGEYQRCPLCRASFPPPTVMYNDSCRRFMSLLENQELPQGSWTAHSDEQRIEMEAIVALWKCAGNEGDSRAQFILGRVYCYGTGVIADLSESLKWYEASGNQGSHDAFLSIGNMFYDGCAATAKDYQKAIEWYLKAAEIGSDKAMKCLGNMHFNGEGTPMSYEQAYNWYLKSAEAGNAQAQFKLANMFYKGQHVSVDFTEALKWYQKAADQDISQAEFMLGSMHFSGRGVKVNFTKAIECFEKASEQGFHIAQFKLGNMYYYAHGAERDYDKAYHYYEKSALKQYANAELMMGIMCYFGQGTEVSYQEAARWYKLAADRNNVIAQLKLGSLFYSGRGMDKDYGQAIHYYEQAAKLNSADAYLLLANMHYKGKGFQRDIFKAVELYEKSAAQNNAASQNMLGNIAFIGEGGTDQSYEKAHNCFLKAATQGHMQATLSLANMYFHGQYEAKNLIEAEKWYREAAKKQIALAQLSLGHISVTNEKYSEAIEWYELAAAQSNVEAEFNLGYLYFNGTGVEKNMAKAKEYFEAAAYHGHARACLYLANICDSNGESKQAVKWYHKASLCGDDEAQLKLGLLLQDGIDGVEVDLDEAKRWLTMSVEKGNEAAVSSLNLLVGASKESGVLKRSLPSLSDEESRSKKSKGGGGGGGDDLSGSFGGASSSSTV